MRSERNSIQGLGRGHGFPTCRTMTKDGPMFRMLTRIRSAWRKSGRLVGRKRPIVGEVLALEQRQLLYFSATLMANPQILFPPTGRGVSVVISGTFTELNRTVQPTDPIP